MLKSLWKKIFKREEFKLHRSVEMFYRRQKAYQIGSKNMFPNITEPQEVVNCLKNVFLGEDWYCTDPLCTGQINSIILDEILYYKCGKKYREAIDKLSF